VKFLAIGEKADLESLSCKQPSDTRVKATHECPLGGGASRSAVADVTYFVGEDLAVEALDPRGDLGLVGEQLDSDAA